MCSPEKKQHQFTGINNDDNLNAEILSLYDSTASVSSGDDRSIDLLNPSLKPEKSNTSNIKSISSSKNSKKSIASSKNSKASSKKLNTIVKKSSTCSTKSNLSSKTLKTTVSADRSNYWDATEATEDYNSVVVGTKGDTSVAAQNKSANILRRQSGITFSDFQLRKTKIEKLLSSPDDFDEKKSRRKLHLEIVENNSNFKFSKENYLSNQQRSNSKTDTIQTHGTCIKSVNECNNYEGRIPGGSVGSIIHKFGHSYTKSSDTKLKVGNINKSLDKSNQFNFRCSQNKYSLIKPSEENKQEQSSSPNFVLLHENQYNCDQTLKGSSTRLSQQNESLISESPSDINNTSSYSTSPENLLCDNAGGTEGDRENNTQIHKRKRKPWTIQETEKRQTKSGPTVSIMYCGDTDRRSNLYTRGGLHKDNLFNQPTESKEKEVRRVFPFEATPSGNLKVGPKQVVFESKKVSILVADPHRTKVNVKADVDDKTPPSTNSGERPSFTPMQLPPVPKDLLSRMPPIPHRMPPQGMGGQLMGRADGDFPTLTPPVSYNVRSEENSSEDTTRVDPKKHKHIPEMNLSRMGYGGKDTIDWNKITLPLKSDLHKLLHHRISNYINPDFIVQIGNHEYRCHLLVLQCYSTFFESLEKSIKSVDLSCNNVTGDAFESLYTWMLHLGQDSYQLLRRDNILEMFMAAQFLGVKELEEQCWAFIDNEELFSEDTAFLLYLDARRLGHTAVMELMVPRIQRFFLTLVSSKDWLELQVDEVTVFLRSNYICIHCEMEVFMSGVRWLMHDWPKRNIHLVDVMQCVRFGLIAPWQLVDIRRNPESPEFIEITKDADVQRMVEDGLAFAIIKYWYGHESHDYYHWIDLLGLSEPASRNWAGTEKNYLAYREFLVDLETYRTAHNKALNEKKKSKSHVEDSDSLDDDSATREHLPPTAAIMSAPTQQQQGNRQNKPNVMQPPPPPPPIPTMVEFIARRNGDPTNAQRVIRRLRGAGSVQEVRNIKDGIINFSRKCDHYCDASRSSCSETSDEERVKRLVQQQHHHHHHHRYHRRKHHHYCCNSESSSSMDDGKGVSTTMKRNRDISGNNTECVESKEAQDLFIQKKAIQRSTSNDSKNIIGTYKNIENKSLKSQAATIIQTFYRSYKARELYKKLLQDKSKQKDTEIIVLKGNNTNKETENPKEIGQQEEKAGFERKSKFVNEASVTPSSENDLKLQLQREKLMEIGVKEMMGKDERIKNVYKKLLPDKVSREMELQLETKNDMLKEKQILLNKDTGNLDISLKQSTTTSNSINDVRKNDMVIETLLYQRKSDTGSRTSLPRPVRIGTIPAEYLVPDSLFQANKECVLVFGGVDPHHSYGIGHNNGKGVFRYIQNRRHWDLVDELPEPRHHHAVAFCKGKVYLIGGADPRRCSVKNKSNVVNSVYSFDPVSRLWEVEASLKIARKNFGLVVCSGKLYAIGGENNQDRLLASVECYCPKKKAWEDVAQLNAPRMGLAATKYRDTIWVAGGYVPSRKNTMARSVECYDQRQNVWHMTPPLRIPRCFASLFVNNDTLYLIGGASYNVREGSGSRNTMSINDVDVWDEREQEWKIHSQLSTARHAHSVCYLGTSLLVIGGVSTERMCALNDVECWNQQRSAWISGIAELPTTLSGHGSITLPPASLL